MSVSKKKEDEGEAKMDNKVVNNGEQEQQVRWRGDKKKFEVERI